VNDLEELKSLLFGAEKQALDSITERVQKPETRSADVADILPEAIRRSHQQGRELVASLREPVGECLTESIHEAPQAYADALYPVMGPAIRKSIIHALRGFAQQINETVEQSFTVRGLKWRFEAWRAGVPFGDYVLQQTLLYRIEQAYLISRENGLLVGHVHHDASRIKDSDAVSAMFTAIQDFVKESFSPDRSGRLETADMGDFTLWAVHGPHALLVCVIRGVPPRSLRSDLSAILERIHFRYGEKIRLYSGDTASVKGVEDELLECLKFQDVQPKKKKSRISAALLITLLVLAAALLYFGVNSWLGVQQHRALSAVIDATPGLYIVDIKRDGGEYTLHGLRDPLAATIDDIAASAGIESTQVTASLRPYQSLDPEIVIRRTRQLLDAPSTVTIVPADDGLIISGMATQAWIDNVRGKLAAGSFGMPVILDDVASTDMTQLQANVSEINNVNFFFENESTLFSEDEVKLREHASSIRSLVRSAERLDAAIAIDVAGYTDSAGSVEFNTNLANLRSEAAIRILVNAGIDDELISRSHVVPTGEFGTPDPTLRKIVVQLTLGAPEYPTFTVPE